MEILRGMEIKITGVIHRLIFKKKKNYFFYFYLFYFFFFFLGGGGIFVQIIGGGHGPPCPPPPIPTALKGHRPLHTRHIKKTIKAKQSALFKSRRTQSNA